MSDLEKGPKKDPNTPTYYDKFKDFVNSKSFVYGALSGIGLLYLKYTIFDNFKPITESEKMISGYKF